MIERSLASSTAMRIRQAILHTMSSPVTGPKDEPVDDDDMDPREDEHPVEHTDIRLSSRRRSPALTH